MSSLPTNTLSMNLMRSLSNPLAFLPLLQAQQQAAAAAAPLTSGGPPTQKTPTPQPQPKQQPAQPTAPTFEGSEFERMRDAAKFHRDAELAALLQSGRDYDPLTLKRIYERYENRLGGIGARERNAKTKAEIPAKRAAQEAAKAERKSRLQSKIAQRKADAFNDSYTSVEDIRARAALERMAAAASAAPTAPAPATGNTAIPTATGGPDTSTSVIPTTVPQSTQPVEPVNPPTGYDYVPNPADLYGPPSDLSSAARPLPASFEQDMIASLMPNQTDDLSRTRQALAELVNFFTPGGYPVGYFRGKPAENQKFIDEAQQRVINAFIGQAGLPNTMAARNNMSDYGQRLQATLNNLTQNLPPEERAKIQGFFEAKGAFPKPPTPAAIQQAVQATPTGQLSNLARGPVGNLASSPVPPSSFFEALMRIPGPNTRFPLRSTPDAAPEPQVAPPQQPSPPFGQGSRVGNRKVQPNEQETARIMGQSEALNQKARQDAALERLGLLVR
jgi:hypothetical protein